MSTQAILNGDWSYYDNLKLKGVDRRKFSCNEKWEVDYLVDKIHNSHPNVAKSTIKAAIETCCQTIESRERDVFVGCVMKRLGLS